jgi:hypothetical protein
VDSRSHVEAIELVPAVDERQIHFPVSPASLLRAESETVRFHGREEELDALLRWCRDPGTPIRLIYGPGGQGKTRLAVELLNRLRADGWAGGFVKNTDTATADPAVRDALLSADAPTLLVVDYAEAHLEAVSRLARTVQRSEGQQVRLLALARGTGRWWTDICDELSLRAPTAVRLRALQRSEYGKHDEYRLALQDLADGLARISGYGRTPWEHLVDTVEETSGDLLGRALAIHMTALAALLEEHGASAAPARAEEVVLRHESRYWARLANSLQLSLSDSTLREAVCVATLYGATGRAEAQAVAERMPGLAGQPADVRHRVVAWLGDLYPGTTADGWQPLEPDQLGEYLIAEEIRRDPAFVPFIAAEVSARQHRRMFTVLNRIVARYPELDTVISSLVSPKTLAEAGVLMEQQDKPRIGRAKIGLLLRKHDRGLASEVPLKMIADQYGYHDLEDFLAAVCDHVVHPETVVSELIAIVDEPS